LQHLTKNLAPTVLEWCERLRYDTWQAGSIIGAGKCGNDIRNCSANIQAFWAGYGNKMVDALVVSARYPFPRGPQLSNLTFLPCALRVCAGSHACVLGVELGHNMHEEDGAYYVVIPFVFAAAAAQMVTHFTLLRSVSTAEAAFGFARLALCCTYAR
jgi:hypothetical protein